MSGLNDARTRARKAAAQGDANGLEKHTVLLGYRKHVMRAHDGESWEVAWRRAQAMPWGEGCERPICLSNGYWVFHVKESNGGR